jgi:hypothetical protein
MGATNQLLRTFNPSLTAAGTPQRLSGSATAMWVREFEILAHPNNAGNCYFGGDTATASAARGRPLAAGESWPISGSEKDKEIGKINLSEIYWDGATGSSLVVSYLEDQS